jgi:hypothetical protein
LLSLNCVSSNIESVLPLNPSVNGISLYDIIYSSTLS